MNLFELLTSDGGNGETAPFARERVVPSQPSGVLPGKIYLGSDLGQVDVSGSMPLPGDLVTVLVSGGKRVCVSAQPVASLREPVFSQFCRCKCPTSSGTIVWANPIETGPYLVIMDQDGNFQQTLNPPQLYRVAGVAVDPNPPHHLYVLDDRTRLSNFVTDSSPSAQIAGVSTYALHTFTQNGTSYTWSSLVEMADPGIPASPFFISELGWVTGGSGNQGLTDPPATYPTNCLSVIGGLLYITMSMRPARYLTWDGAAFTTHHLQQNGANFNFGLRGMVLTGIDKPGKPTSKFVLSWAGFGGFSGDGCNDYTVLEFDANDQILRVLSSTAFQSPIALMLMCNRVIVLNSDYYGRTEDGGSSSLDGSFIQVGTGP